MVATAQTETATATPLGRYLLFDVIARGGMATVHFGRLNGPVGFARTVAIKRLHPHLATNPEFVAMFLDEARLASRIRHPNVVPTVDVVASDNEVFIVMEYVQGESLARLWRTVRGSNERIPIRIALAIIAGALHGLHAAHEVTDEEGQPLNIVHRDVSPQNILVGTDGVPRVLDFGVAKAAGRLADTGDGSLKGKVAYMAPEHITGAGVSRRTDIFAISVVLWELLVGERLFDAENDIQRLAKILSDVGSQMRPPSAFNPEVSPRLDAIVMRGLSSAPEDRFATAKEMAVLLEQSGGLVSASEIGDWVMGLAATSLTQRATQLSLIESSTSRRRAAGPLVPPAAPEAPTLIAPPLVAESPPTRRGGVILLALLSLVLVGGALFVIGRRTASHPAPPIPSLAVSVPVSASATAPPPSAPAIVTVVASAAPEPSVKAAPSRHPRTARPRDECDPPYTIDDENHKIYKRQCIK